ncbi:hypothetical protein D2E26_0987 [Bifidobacterium dolichotidis]|uniref:Uncharacterized protein n=1 Tax=Bifidobacterium dolichotidis TaxID=2306976 RepID=A0A430FQ21_9BIFI|nr:hypothetical protein [Bifidobacterium dolichotidis]RSX54933.1 hypothetical protein D2E26_0987 [Bifidobacterium dolichotidis]
MVHIAKGYRRSDVQQEHDEAVEDQLHSKEQAKAKVGANGKPILMPLDVPEPPRKGSIQEDKGFARSHPYLIICAIGIALIVIGLGVSIVLNAVGTNAAGTSIVLSICMIVGAMAVILGPLCVWMSRTNKISPNLDSSSNNTLRRIVECRRHPGARFGIIIAEIAIMVVFAVLSYFCMHTWHQTVLAIVFLIFVVAAPLVISNLYQESCLNHFMKLKDGSLKHIKLFGTNASAVKGEPNVCLTMPVDGMAFEVLYNWVSPYLDSKRMTIYTVPLKISVPGDTMRFDVLVIPLTQLKDDAVLRKQFKRECKIVGAGSIGKLLGDE